MSEKKLAVNEGIKIHRTKCPNATELLSRHGDRVIKAKWASQIDMAFTAGLTIRGLDRVGLVNDVTKIISSEFGSSHHSRPERSDDSPLRMSRHSRAVN